ncbi:MAG: peptidase T [Candidatus Lokiarchaeota archaeon]|nr:peptidase T [Candidatus Lokiarchaeota archaeon]
MKLSEKIQDIIYQKVISHFLKYVKINSTSNEDSNSFPSTKEQIEFGKILVDEMHNLEIKNIIHDKFGYIYAHIPASKGYKNVQPIGLIAHLDTSPTVSGIDVEPIIHRNYNSEDIHFEKNKNQILSPKDSPELLNYIGYDIITSKGDTLLGADDKAGIAEIITACDIWNKFPEIKHGPIVICFFPDEELGKGTQNINISKLPNICYTIDGSEMGLLEIECFDAWKIEIIFNGLNIHPGYAKDIMINSIHIASKFLSELPELESPEHTEEREGFYHLSSLEGNEEKSKAIIIIRDFEISSNQKRIIFLKKLKELYEKSYSGLRITMNIEHQYSNMKKYLQRHPKIIELAKQAINMADLEYKIHSIRGGTDGAHLSAKGIPTPNLFTGGLLFHSKKEYIPTIALKKATEVIIYLALLYVDNKE